MVPAVRCTLLLTLLQHGFGQTQPTQRFAPFWNWLRNQESLQQVLTPDVPPMELSALLREGNEDGIRTRLFSVQAPADCKTAKYLIMDPLDPVRGSGAGWGWAFFVYSQQFWRGIAEGRTVVFATAANSSWHWWWCQRPPYSYQCYFEDWSTCDARMSIDFGELRKEDVVVARDILPHRDAQFVSFIGGQYLDPDAGVGGEHPPTWEPAISAHYHNQVTYGLIWWIAEAMRVMLQPRPWLVAMADKFLEQHNPDSRPFIVVHMRRGNKNQEAELKPLELFAKQVARAGRCLWTNKVHVMTESVEALTFMKEWGAENGFEVFYTENTRSEADLWNQKMHGEEHAAKPNSMDEQGLVAALNLVIASRGAILIGTLSSHWAKPVLAGMYAHHGRPRHMITVEHPHHIDMQTFSKFFYREHERGFIISDLDSDSCEDINRQ